LAQRITQQGGKAQTFTYNGNNHALKRSPYRWFSPQDTTDGFPEAIKRDILLFSR
jgi:hypothetical protein